MRQHKHTHTHGKVCLQRSKLKASLEIDWSSPRADKKPRLNNYPWPFGPTVCLLGLWSDYSGLHAPVNVADQSIGCIAKFCWCILATHPITEISPQPKTLYYDLYMLLQVNGMMPSNDVIENAKWFSKKHTLYWTVDLLDRLRPTWVTSIPVSSDTLLSGMTGIHHSFV